MEKVRAMVEERVQERVRAVVQREVRATVCEVQARLSALARENDRLRDAFVEHSDVCLRSLLWTLHPNTMRTAARAVRCMFVARRRLWRMCAWIFGFPTPPSERRATPPDAIRSLLLRRRIPPGCEAEVREDGDGGGERGIGLFNRNHRLELQVAPSAPTVEEVVVEEEQEEQAPEASASSSSPAAAEAQAESPPAENELEGSGAAASSSALSCPSASAAADSPQECRDTAPGSAATMPAAQREPVDEEEAEEEDEEFCDSHSEMSEEEEEELAEQDDEVHSAIDEDEASEPPLLEETLLLEEVELEEDEDEAPHVPSATSSASQEAAEAVVELPCDASLVPLPPSPTVSERDVGQGSPARSPSTHSDDGAAPPAAPLLPRED